MEDNLLTEKQISEFLVSWGMIDAFLNYDRFCEQLILDDKKPSEMFKELRENSERMLAAIMGNDFLKKIRENAKQLSEH